MTTAASGRGRSRAPDGTQDRVAARHQEDSLTARIQTIEQSQHVSRESDPLLRQQAASANPQGLPLIVGHDAGARMSQEFVNRIDRQLTTGRFLRDEPGQRMFAALLRGGGRAQQFVLTHVPQSNDLAQLQPALGQGAGLVEGDGRHLGQSLQG